MCSCLPSPQHGSFALQVTSLLSITISATLLPLTARLDGHTTPSPQTGGRVNYPVYKNHKEELDKIASDEDARPCQVKDFMEQQGYMYFDAKGLLRYVRN